MEIRVVVTSSRTWKESNPAHVRVVANALLAVEIVVRGSFRSTVERQEITFVHGGARGGDTIVDLMAVNYGFQTERCPVTEGEWHLYGKAAGPRRNRAMLDDPRGCHMLLAIRRGGALSRGTTDCISAAQERLIPRMVLDYP